MALHDEDHSSPPTHEYDAVKPTAEFVLALRQGHHILQSALNMVIENTEMLLQSTLSTIKTQLHVVLRKNGLDLEEELGNVASFPGHFWEEKTAWALLLAHSHRSHKNLGICAWLYTLRLFLMYSPVVGSYIVVLLA